MSRKVYLARLRELREDRGVGMDEMIKALDVLLETYKNYETGATNPPFAKIVKIADMFGVSIDYLIGHDTRDCADTTEEAVCNYIGFSPEAVRAWHKTRETRIYWRVTR